MIVKSIFNPKHLKQTKVPRLLNTTNMTTTNTIERIRWERKRVQKELKHLEQVIADDYNELTAPPPPSNNKLETMISVASRAWNIFDGAMMGYKLFRRFGKASRGISKGKRK